MDGEQWIRTYYHELRSEKQDDPQEEINAKWDLPLTTGAAYLLAETVTKALMAIAEAQWYAQGINPEEMEERAEEYYVAVGERHERRCNESDAWGGAPPHWCDLPKGHKGEHRYVP